MADAMYLPPKRADLLTPAVEVAARLRQLVGTELKLTGKTRTDGANARKLIAATLAGHPLPEAASDADWRCAPPKGKGVPGLLREYLDTYIVTSGTSYNLQVWNRDPSSASVQIEFVASQPPLLSSDARFVLVRIDTTTHRIRCVAVLSPDYIVRRFGRFGRPTVKQQLIISPSARIRVYSAPSTVIFHADDPRVATLTATSADLRNADLRLAPAPPSLLRIETIRDLVVPRLCGAELRPSATKTRGQALELLVADALGYRSTAAALVGGYPDIRHQALEVKVQDAPTVDLGRYSPQFDEEVPGCTGFTTQSIRYLIALTDPGSNRCCGVVLCPGGRLGDYFTYVADKSFKCQRSIPMSFFDGIDGQSVFNP